MVNKAGKVMRVDRMGSGAGMVEEAEELTKILSSFPLRVHD